MTDLRQLFVYGTLRPGGDRWPLLSPFLEGPLVAAEASGELFDTGLGYPAARFGAGPSRVVGEVGALGGQTFDLALALLDEEEGTVAGLYRRVVVTTSTGPAWAYEYGAGLDLTPIGSGDWFSR